MHGMAWGCGQMVEWFINGLVGDVWGKMMGGWMDGFSGGMDGILGWFG